MRPTIGELPPQTRITVLIFLISHFVQISTITRKSRSACNSTTQLPTTRLLQRMLRFMLKAAKRLQPTLSYGTVHTLLSSYSVRNYEWQHNSGLLRRYYTPNDRFSTTMHLLQLQSKVRLTSSRPDHSLRSVFANRIQYFLVLSTICRILENFCTLAIFFISQNTLSTLTE